MLTLFDSIMPWVIGFECFLVVLFIAGCERDIARSKEHRILRERGETGDGAECGTMESYGKTGT